MKSNRLIYIWLLIISLSNSNNNANNETIINNYNITGFSTDLTEVYKKCKDAIVTVQSETNTLSGFVYKQDQNRVYILTAYHGISDSNKITVVFGSTYFVDAILLDYDYLLDLAVLYVETPYQIETVKLSDATSLKAGEFVLSIGTPNSIDYAGSVELGMIADNLLTIENSITYNDERINYFLDVIELSSSLKSGYSGSPILNMNGEVVGMNTMSLNNNINFANTINEIKLVADRMIAGDIHDKVLFGIKGEYVKDMASYEKNNLNINIDTIDGLYIQKVRDNSLAYNAGIRSNDVILSINNRQIQSLNDYLEVVYSNSDNYAFNINRNGEIINIIIGND